VKVLSVNVAVPRPNPLPGGRMTGIDKQPVTHPISVRTPQPAHSGVAGDMIGDIDNHGGADQAVYAYAREDLDWWESSLGRPLPSGFFGENLTTVGMDVNGASIGEIWKVGDTVALQVTFGRIPCATFQARMEEPRWTRRFAEANRTGAYLRVVTPGSLQVGDPIEVVHRPSSEVSIAEAFHIWMFDHDSFPRLLSAEGLPAGMRAKVLSRLSSS